MEYLVCRRLMYVYESQAGPWRHCNIDVTVILQDLTVTVMSEKSSEEIELVEDPFDMHRVNKQSFVDEQEWQLYKCIDTELKVRTYPYTVKYII